jgi:CRISPR system Cascade subunit CasD
MKKHAILVLEGPMQSWGLQKKFDYRSTMPLPTKSGVVGLVCAAMGIERNDRDNIAKLSALDMSVLTIKRGTLITDYHTIGGGYSKNEKSRVVPKANGSKGDTVVTRREYLADASFVVVLSGDSELIDRCAAALDNPVWNVFLGKRCCMPSRPILEVVVDTEDQVRATVAQLGVTPGSSRLSDGQGEVFQNDVPVDFKAKIYRTRPVVQESVFV